MRKIALCLMILVAMLVTPAFAQVGDRVELPDNDGAMWITVFLNAENWETDANTQQLARLLADPRMKHLRKYTRNGVYFSSGALYRDKFAPYVAGKFPTFYVQSAEGEVLYKKSGDGIPRTADAMVRGIETKVGRFCKPKPKPKPVPKPEPAVKPIPDSPEPEVEEEGGISLILAILGGVATLGGGAYVAYRRTHGN